MSRAFVTESDLAAASETMPERPLSPHPNFVTPEGLKQIETQIHALEDDRQAAKADDDGSRLALITRDLRYWNQRRASARVIEPAAEPDVVRFGVLVTLALHDSTERSFRLVGEDEADPAQELLSWVSPVAASLIGKTVGDSVEFQGHKAKIVRLAS